MTGKKSLIISAVVLFLVTGLIVQVWRTKIATPESFFSQIEGRRSSRWALPRPEEKNTKLASQGFVPTQMEDPQKYEAFKKALSDLAECLGVEVGELSPQAEIHFDYLNSLFSSEFGEIVSQREEWSAKDIRTSSGEVRRIFIESSHANLGEKQTKLSYFSYAASGEQSELPLLEEQKINPSEGFIASLEAEGQLIGQSSSRYIVYRNGNDGLVIDKNGKLYAFGVSHNGRSFSCTNADSAELMKCQCE